MLTAVLLLLACGLLYRKAEERRGFRPFWLAVSALPAMLAQPVLLAASSGLDYSMLAQGEALTVLASMASWYGVAMMVFATSWNASLDQRLPCLASNGL